MCIITVIYNDLCYSDVCVFKYIKLHNIVKIKFVLCLKLTISSILTGVFKNNKYTYCIVIFNNTLPRNLGILSKDISYS